MKKEKKTLKPSCQERWLTDTFTHLLYVPSVLMSRRHWIETHLKETGDYALIVQVQFDAVEPMQKAWGALSLGWTVCPHTSFCSHSNTTVTISVRYCNKADKTQWLFYRSTVWGNKKLKKTFLTYLPIKYQNRSDFNTAKSRELTQGRILMFPLTITYYTPACISFSSSYENTGLKM